MSHEQTAVIEPAVRDALAAGAGWCLTLTVADDPKKWVQLANGATVVAAFPHPDDPVGRLGALGPFGIGAWVADTYVEGRLDLTDAGAIAGWIDGYFRTVLGCAAPYALDRRLERM